MHCYTRRHPVRIVLLIVFFAGLVTLLVGCSRSWNSSLSGSERITVSVEQAAAVLSTGTLPGGLGLDGTSGAISGTPTKTGTSTFSVEVSDTSSPKQTAAAQFSIVVSTGAVEPSRTGEDLSGGQVGASSSHSSAGYTILVWMETSDSNTGRICASRVDRDGRVLDETPIEIAKAGERGFSDPSVCFGANSWLVTWLEQGSETRIRAARVGPDGTVYDKTGFDVGTGCDEQSFDTDYRPSVAWVGSGWLVMYGVDAGRNDVALAATLVGEDGSVLTPEPMQWGRTATRGSVLFETIDSVRALEDSPFCVPGRSGYAILADIFISDRVATYWGAPRVNVVAASGVSVSDGWFTLQDEGEYRPASGDSVYDIAGCFGLTRWLVAWSIENYTRGVNDARLAMLESAESGARIVFVRTLAEQESWHPVGLSIAAPGDKDEWFVTWIAERPQGSGRDIVGTVVNAEGEVGQPRVIMPLFSSGDEYDSGNGVATAWNGQKYIIAHAAEIDAKPTQILVTCVTADGSPRAQTATIELQGRVSVVAAACDKAIPAPQVTFKPLTSVPGSDSPTPGVYLAPLDPRMCLELREDGALTIGTLNEDGTGFEDADQGRWTRSGDEITLDLSAPYSGIHGRVVHDGLVFAEERQISALGLFSVVWVREGAPAPLDLGFRWQRVGGDSRERLILDNNLYELSILNTLTDYLGSYTGSFTWDGRTARLKTPWYDADVITWNYVYLDGRLYYWNMDSVGIWECIDASLTTPGTPSSAAAPGSSTAATPATTPTVSTTPATTPTIPVTPAPVTPSWRRNIEPGDILYSPDFLDPLVGHAAIYVGDGHTIEAGPGGVQTGSLESWDLKNEAALFGLSLPTDRVYAARAGAIEFARAQVGKPYDFNWSQKDSSVYAPSWYCSELVWAAFMNQGVNLERTPDTGPVTPREVSEDSLLTYLKGRYIGFMESGGGPVFRTAWPVTLVVVDPTTPAAPTTPMTSVPPIATSTTPTPAALPVDNGMVTIPAGSFLMGDSFGEGDSKELPVHTVAVSAFTMDRYEVTKALWDEVATWAAANGYDLGPGDGSGKAADHPVYNVSWYKAVKWANARSEKEGLTACYTLSGSVYRTGENAPDCNWSASGYRLPTEAEWEKAARGGAEGHRFPWSDVDTIDHTRANYHSDSGYSYDTSPTRSFHPAFVAGAYPYTSPVGSFAPNGYGVYDMAGNVFEWCWDWVGETTYESSLGSDPRGPASGSFRAFRGGCWYYFASGCRVAYRNSFWPDLGDYDLGFRLVRTAPVPLSATTPATTPAAPTTPMTSVPPIATSTTPVPAALPVDNGMATIPAGSFQMGDSFGEGNANEVPMHTVAVSAFTMDRYEVTKALWDEVATWAAANGYDIGPEDGSGKAADHPVYDVTWYEAVKWANARSEKGGAEPCYTVSGSVYRSGQSAPDCNWSPNGYRLPTEAEWEKAARGGAEGHRFPWSDVDTIDHTRANYHSDSGDSYDTSPTLGFHPTYATGDYPYTSPVGSFAPNGYGLYDMAGNVWEWCWDWYGADLPGGVDPRGPASGSVRAIRGGSWHGRAIHCRVAARYSYWPGSEGYDLGFRLVRTAP